MILNEPSCLPSPLVKNKRERDGRRRILNLLMLIQRILLRILRTYLCQKHASIRMKIKQRKGKGKGKRKSYVHYVGHGIIVVVIVVVDGKVIISLLRHQKHLRSKKWKKRRKDTCNSQNRKVFTEKHRTLFSFIPNFCTK